MYTLGILNDIGNAIMDGIRTLMLTLCDGIYRLIYFTFYIFEKLGTANILKEGQLEGIFTRIGLIIGIFMVFRVSFAFIQYIIDPDAMADKNKGIGNIVKKIVIAIVLLGSTTSLFKLAYRVQDLIIDNHIISKLIFNNDMEDTDGFGGRLSAEVFTAFYRLNSAADTEGNDCEYYFINDDNINIIKENIAQKHGSLDIAYSCITERDSNDNYIIDFDGGGLIALVMGIAVLYTIAIFTIQVGVRLVQLAYLQIIAPIPIIMYVTPKGDDYLKKWGTQCLTTFLDFFIRTAIIYFAVAIIQNLMETSTLSAILSGGGSTSSGWQTAYVFVIMVIAILTFAKKAPALLKEIFPSLGGAAAFDYGLSFKKQVVEPLKSAYNSPIGWIPKLAVKGVTSGAAAIDRKLYDLPKPRGKVGQTIDKLLPGQAEARKNRMQAQIEAGQREGMLEKGANLNARYPKADDLVAEFKNSEYKESYMNLRRAKKANGEAELELEAVRSNLNTAVASGNKEAIEIAKERLKTATDNLHSAQGNLELAKTRHESNKKIYRKDAEIEGAYKYYADTHSERKDYEREMPDLGEQSQQDQINETLQEILRRQSGVNANTEGHVNSRQEANVETTTQSGVQARVDNVTGVSRNSASANGAPTEDNSLLGELADQVEQERLRSEVLNNLRNDNSGNNNENR